MNQPSKNIEAPGENRREFSKKTVLAAAAAAGVVAAVVTRREFLKKSTLAGAAVAASQNLFKTPVYGQPLAPSMNVVGANDKIVTGYIGVGLQGKTHVDLQKKYADQNNITQAAVCDLSATRRAAAKAAIGGNCQEYESFEKLLENKDIDAVTIATPEHWHSDMAVAALQAGKHLYLEKPMSRYLDEAFAVYDTVKKNPKLTFQIGSQGCSDAKWAKARSVILAGKVGKLVLGQASYMRNSKEGEWNGAPYVFANWMTVQDLNWDKWQGKVAHKVPFEQERFVRWRKYYPYSAGPLGDLCPHTLHPALLATGNPEFPSRVVCLGQKPVDVDKAGNFPERDCPEDVQLLVEFPSGYALVMIAGTVNQVGLESVIRGHLATLVIGGNRVELRPEAIADDIDPDTFSNLAPTEAIEVHEANWFDCIRSNGSKIPNANADLAIRVQTILCLAEMSNRLNMTCVFDEKTRKITSADNKVVEPITYGTLEKS